MEALTEWILRHAEHAHWFIFGAILLAGFNIPISADLMIVIGGFLAATVIPEHLWHLYFAIFVGCYFSAWITYWFGRLLGKRFSKYGWFNRLMPPQRLEKIQRFYSKHGLWTLLLGRFIPFGVRNCIFMSSGMSRISFLKFALWDLMACFTWTAAAFYCFFTLGQNYHLLFDHLKTINIIIFLAFSVTVIGLIWYKRRKKTALKNT
jgi:membrane protein DedA with SNARE-associated domain